MTIKLLKGFFVLLLAQWLVACGGGGDGTKFGLNGDTPTVSTSSGAGTVGTGTVGVGTTTNTTLTSLTVSTGATSIIADGSSKVAIFATANNSDSSPLSGQVITFSTNFGTLSATSATTDANGQASVLLTGATSVGVALISVASSNGVGGTASVSFLAGTATTVTMNAAPATINALGATTVTAKVTDANNNPLVGEAVTFDVTTNATSGSLSAVSATTNANGNAIVTYTAGNATGTDTVTAKSANAVVGTANITVNTSGVVVNSVTMTLGAANITADATSTTSLSAKVLDTNGSPVTGQAVNFTTTLGTLLSDTAVTDATGNAVVTLKSATTSGTASVSATSSGFSGVGVVTFVAGKATTVAVSAAPATVNTSGATNIKARVTDANGNPLVGETVTFDATTNTSLGSLASVTATTDANGDANVTYNSGSVVGTDTITAKSTNAITGSVNITVNTSGVVVNSIALALGATSITADATSTTSLNAKVVDTDGAAVAGQTVTFTTTLGTLSAATAVTDANGNASVTLTSVITAGSAAVLVTASGFSNSGTVSFVAGKAATVSVSAAPTTVNTAGSTSIKARVLDANGNPLIGESVTFDVSTNTSIGSLNNVTATTDANGDANVTYSAGTVVGTDTITAKSSNAITGTANITVSTSGVVVNSIALTLGSSSITADGASTVSLNAKVLDSNGAAVAGQTVTFSSTLGVVSSATATTDANGNAVSTLKSAITAGSASVLAAASGFNSTGTVSFVAGTATSVAVSAAPSTVNTGGTTTVSAKVTDANSNPLVGETVTFEVTTNNSVGSLASVTATTNANGNASVTYNAGTTAGTDTITVKSTNATASTATVTVNASGVVVNSVAVTLGATSITADGTSTVSLSAKVLDINGAAVVGQSVSFTSTLGSLSAATGTTDSAGNASVTLKSGTTTGSASVAATISGFTSTGAVSFVAGKATTPTVTIAPSSINTGSVTTITAKVVDANANALVGETVKFNVSTNVSGGALSATSAVTNVNGLASVTYTSGNTVGTDKVTATNGLGVSSVATNIVVSAAVSTITLSAGASSILADGTSSTILRAAVTDTSGGPIVGLTVTFTTTLGSLSSATATTDSSGNATVTLTSVATAGSASILATASGFNSTTTVSFVAGKATTPTVTITPASISTGGTSTITAKVVDTNAIAVSGETITFNVSTNVSGGTLSAITADTDVNGVATVTYTAGNKIGTDVVKATNSLGASSATSNIVVGAAVSTVELLVGKTSMVANGSETATIRATVKDVSSNAISGSTVTFTSSAGALSSATATTNSSGIAEVTLTSPSKLGASVLVAIDGGISSTSQTVSFVSDVVNTVTAVASPTKIPYNGTTVFTFTATDTNGNPVKNEVLTLSVSTNNSVTGSLAALTATTDVNGRATVNYTGGTTTGVDTIKAVTTTNISGTATVNVDPSAATLGTLEFSEPSGSGSLEADGSSLTLLRATLKDTAGVPIQGQAIAFTKSQGTLSAASVTTDSNGMAEVNLTSSTSSGSAIVKAAIGGFSKTLTISFTAGAASSIKSSISAAPSTIPADGTSTTTVTVLMADANTNLLPNGTTVTLATDKGTVQSTTANPNPATTVSGRATFILTADTTPGDATITVSELSGLSKVVKMGVTSDGQAASISLASNNSSIAVAGVGQTENATITVSIVDGSGSPIDETNWGANNTARISFVTQPSGGEFISGKNKAGTTVTTSSTTSIDVITVGGTAQINLQSGTLPGIVELKVEALNQSGAPYTSSITASVPQISIASGPAETMVISSPITSGIENLGNGFYRQKAAVAVTDRYGNNVPDGTVVNLGLIDTVLAEAAVGSTSSASKVLTDAVTGGLNFTTKTVTSNNVARLILPNDRVLITNADASDKSRFVSSIAATAITTQANYNKTASSLKYKIGASLLGSFVSGLDGTTLTKGVGKTKDGIADIRITYPADINHIMAGVNATTDSRFAPAGSAKEYVVATVNNSGAAVISADGQFSFSPIAGFTLTPNTTKISGTTTITLSLIDGGDKVRLPFYPVGASAAVTKGAGGVTLSFPSGAFTDVNGNIQVKITITAGFITDDTAEINVVAGDATVKIDYKKP